MRGIERAIWWRRISSVLGCEPISSPVRDGVNGTVLDSRKRFAQHAHLKSTGTYLSLLPLAPRGQDAFQHTARRLLEFLSRTYGDQTKAVDRIQMARGKTPRCR
jgi:hypothetical protein